MDPIQYPKIQTLLKRDKDFKVIEVVFSCPEFEYLSELPWIVREKIDGTNIRVFWDGEVVRFYGRTSNSQIPTFLLEKLQDMFPVRRFVSFKPVCLYGEGYGAKIQKVGKDYLPDAVSFRLFDVRVGDWWLKEEDVWDVADTLNIDTIPHLVGGVYNLPGIMEVVKQGFKSAVGNCAAEGVVLLPVEPLYFRNGKRIIAKLKTTDFRRKEDA